MSSALWIGTTGLAAATKQMDIIGNNLANANTIGFKSGDAAFASMLSQSLSGGSEQQVGQGVGVAAISTSFVQGSYETTGSATDVAIDGNGFFIVKNPKDDLTYFTRAGSFYLNELGDLVDNSGYEVQGREFTADGTESTDLATINLAGRKSTPQETVSFSLGLNLDSEMLPSDEPNYFTANQTIFDAKGSKHALATSLYRSDDVVAEEGERSFWYMKARIGDGEEVVATRPWLEFDNTGVMQTETPRMVIASEQLLKDTTVEGAVLGAGTKWGIFTNSDESATYDFSNGKTINYTLNGVAAPEYTINTGIGTDTVQNFLDHIEANAPAGTSVKATFAEGTLVLIDKVTGESNMEFSFQPGTSGAATAFGTVVETNTFGQSGAALPQDAIFDFVDQNESWGDGGKITWNLAAEDAPEITSYAMDSRINSMKNNGYPAGLLNSLSVGVDGIIRGAFTNGQQQNLARLRTASFASQTGLDKVGNYFSETNASGTASVGNPGEGELGKCQSNSLEISNTDVAKEFIKMIAAQRAYQSNSKIITAADEMLQELMNIKR